MYHILIFASCLQNIAQSALGRTLDILNYYFVHLSKSFYKILEDFRMELLVLTYL